jgi:hypothetical protein
MSKIFPEKNIESIPAKDSSTDIEKELEELSRMNVIEMKAALCQNVFHDFVKEFWGEISGDRFVDSPHIKFLCDEVQKVGDAILNQKNCDRGLVVNIAPGSSKSTIISVMLNAWLWTMNSSIEIISASNVIAVAKESNRKTLAILNSDKYKIFFPWVKLGSTQNILEFTTTTNGKRYCCSAGSTIRGVHGRLLICDDLDSIESVSNEGERQKTQDWITGTFLTRKNDNDKTHTIFVQQRLGKLDSSNFLLETNNYDHICLPAEYDERIVKPFEAKSLYNADGLLNPKRFSRKVLDAKRIEMGSAAYNAQYLQNPAGDGESGIVHKSWMQVISRFEFDRIASNKFYSVNFFCDPAFTVNIKRNDPTAILACTVIENILYILNVERKWLETPELIKFIKEWVTMNGYSPNRSKIMMEPKGPGLSLISMLRTQVGLNVIPGTAYNRHHGDKKFRLQAVTPTVESGRVKLVEGKYVKMFLDELTVMDSRHDDMKDIFSMAVNEEMCKPKNYGKLNFSISK